MLEEGSGVHAPNLAILPPKESLASLLMDREAHWNPDPVCRQDHAAR